MGAYISVSLPILLLAAAMQSSIVPQIRVLGGGPDFVFLAVLSWSIHADLDEGITWAFVGGILQDLLSAAPTGASVLGMLLMVFVVYGLNRQLYRVGLLLLAVLAFGGTFVEETTLALVLALTGLGSDYLLQFSYVMIPTAFYNLALIWIVYAVLRPLQRRIKREPRVFR